jgi:hypothetical protein
MDLSFEHPDSLCFSQISLTPGAFLIGASLIGAMVAVDSVELSLQQSWPF